MEELQDGFVEVLPPLAEGEGEGASLLFSQLARAIRIHNLYPEDNRIRIEFMDRMHQDFDEFLTRFRTFNVSIQETTFTYKDRVVHREPDLRISLPMRFFRDGVRRLVFHQGFERSELVGLLDVLNTVAASDDFDNDVVTLLWEQDFSHLSYFVIEDPFEDDIEDDFSGSLDSCEVSASENLRPHLPPKVSAKELAQVLTITLHDLTVARYMVAQELLRNLRHDLTTMLFELLTLRRGDEISFHQTVELLSRIGRGYVKVGRLGEAAEILRKFREALGLDLTGDQRELIHEEFEANRSIEVIRHVQQQFDRPELRDPKGVTEFLMLLGPKIVPELLRMATRVAHPKVLVEVLFTLSPQSADVMLRDFASPDPEIVRRTVDIISSLQDPRFLPPLLGILDHPVMAVRMAVVHGIAATEGSAGRSALMTALKNPDFHVRVQALKCLEVRSDPMILPLLRELVSTEEFRKRGAPEQQGFLFVVARLGGPESTPILRWMLGQAKRFSSPRTRRLAICAAAALGRIRCPDAAVALETYRGPRKIREACQVALSGRGIAEFREEEE